MHYVCNAKGGVGEWNELLQYFRSNGRIYVAGEVPGMDVLCFSTNGQRQLLNKYCEVIGMDVTYKTNIEGRFLCEVLVTDSLGRGRAVMFAFMTSENLEQYRHVGRALRAMLNDGKMPSTFVVDKCAASMEAIREVFPGTALVICKFHVLRAIRRKARRNESLCVWFRNAMETEKESRFNHCLNVLRRVSPRFGAYLDRCWLPIKEMWATYFMTALTYGCTTNNRVESAHRWLKHFLEHQYPLFKSAKLPWSYANKIVREHQDAVAISLQKFKQYDVDLHEQRLLDKLTAYAADLVYRSMNLVAVITAGPVCGRTVTTINRLSRVSATVDIIQWTCTCRSYAAYKLPCTHILAAAHSIFYRMDLLPLPRRWQRLYLESPSPSTSTSHAVIQHRQPVRRRSYRLHRMIDAVEQEQDPTTANKVMDAMETAGNDALSRFSGSQQPIRRPTRTTANDSPSNQWNICNLCGIRVRTRDRHLFLFCVNHHPMHMQCAERHGYSVECVVCQGDLHTPYHDASASSSANSSSTSSPSTSTSSDETVLMRIQSTSLLPFRSVDLDEESYMSYS
ncbi:unnamed protein product [Calicophoron daubneyi]|uniref:SWIM-type domain-containing protein n=1 Tax=Calicophoron daubneyi TaxID=300641 RepID=A0AAV2T619_CALDB